jgi:hypothetical protein
MSFETVFHFGKIAGADILFTTPIDATVSKVIELVSDHVKRPIAELKVSDSILPKKDKFADCFEPDTVYELISTKITPVGSLLSEIAPAISELHSKIDVSNAELLYESKGSFIASCFRSAVGESVPTLLLFAGTSPAAGFWTGAVFMTVPWSTSGSRREIPGLKDCRMFSKMGTDPWEMGEASQPVETPDLGLVEELDGFMQELTGKMADLKVEVWRL